MSARESTDFHRRPFCGPPIIELYDLDEKRLTMDRTKFNMPVLSAPPYTLLVSHPISQPREDQEDEGYNEQKCSARYGSREGP